MSIELKTPCTTIDTSVLESYRALQDAGDPDLVTELIDMFLADLPARLAQLRRVVTEADPVATQRAAHVLKGAAATLGATALAGLCDYVETTARAGTVAMAADLLGEIEQEAERSRDALLRERRP